MEKKIPIDLKFLHEIQTTMKNSVKISQVFIYIPQTPFAMTLMSNNHYQAKFSLKIIDR